MVCEWARIYLLEGGRERLWGCHGSRVSRHRFGYGVSGYQLTGCGFTPYKLVLSEISDNFSERLLD